MYLAHWAPRVIMEKRTVISFRSSGNRNRILCTTDMCRLRPLNQPFLNLRYHVLELSKKMKRVECKKLCESDHTWTGLSARSTPAISSVSAGMYTTDLGLSKVLRSWSFRRPEKAQKGRQIKGAFIKGKVQISGFRKLDLFLLLFSILETLVQCCNVK